MLEPNASNMSEDEDDIDVSDSDVDDEELIPDILELKPKLDDDLSSVVIVDGCPIVQPDRVEKLKAVLKKMFSKHGDIVYEWYPVDENGHTKGYVFFGYANAQQAADTVRNLDGKLLDKAHTFLVNLLTDYEKVTTVQETFVPPPAKEYKDYGNLGWWLTDEWCRDQFITVHGDQGELLTSMYWNSPTEAQLIEQRKRWTVSFVRWSTRGTYLATMHDQGVALWGGPKFEQMNRMHHIAAQMIDFSPSERFMVSFSKRPDSAADPQAIIVWDIALNARGRGFHNEEDAHWPVFKWSHDDLYFARMLKDAISIYETPSYGMLDKNSLKVEGGRDFSWSPSDNIIAYWVPEMDNSPARVVLVEIPSRRELCSKNLFSVGDISLIWQNQGDFLAIRVQRYTKKKLDTDKVVKYLGTYTSFEIIRLREKQYPVDKLEFKDSVVTQLQWEPTGSRFAILLTDAGETKLSVALYDVKPGSELRELKTFDKSSTKLNEIRWSPKGTYLVIAGLKSGGGILEFFDASEPILICRGEHMLASEVHWDPTGRYLATVVTSFHSRTDNAVWMWSCTGRTLYKLLLPGLRLFAWRPRPPSFLSADQLKALKKNMAKYSAKFVAEDRMQMKMANRELMDKRRQQMEEFQVWRQKLAGCCGGLSKETRNGGDTTEQPESGGSNNVERVEILISVETVIVHKNPNPTPVLD